MASGSAGCLIGIRRGYMTESEKTKILDSAKDFFRSHVMTNHLKNTKKLTSVKEFNYNPFIIKYLSSFVFGDSSPESIAKVLLYPRVLGTSISTTFGTQIQAFCNTTLSSFASTTSGIDIEFIDSLDGRRKYCQVKAGPNNINHDDVETISNHFQSVIYLARTNRLKLDVSDFVVGVLYGEYSDLSIHYKNLEKKYTVLVGKDFWYHLTGDISFYNDLIEVFSHVGAEARGSGEFADVIKLLSEDIKKSGI